MTEPSTITEEELTEVRKLIQFVKDCDIYEMYGTNLKRLRRAMVKSGVSDKLAIATVGRLMIIHEIVSCFGTHTDANTEAALEIVVRQLVMGTHGRLIFGVS